MSQVSGNRFRLRLHFIIEGCWNLFPSLAGSLIMEIYTLKFHFWCNYLWNICIILVSPSPLQRCRNSSTWYSIFSCAKKNEGKID